MRQANSSKYHKSSTRPIGCLDVCLMVLLLAGPELNEVHGANHHIALLIAEKRVKAVGLA